MKTLITLVISLLTSCLMAQQYSYLKLNIGNNNHEINYPPNTKFMLKNTLGETVFNHENLKETREYEINSPSELLIFTSWNPEPDRYTLSNATLSLKSNSRTKEFEGKNFQFDRTKFGDPVSLFKKRLIASSIENMTNVSLVFSNGIIFYYEDGKARAWLDGEELKIEGEYRIYSTLGTLKLSYDPYTTDLWYVFESAK